MNAFAARLGIWVTRYAPQFTVLRGIALAAGYANLHVASVATQVAIR